MNGTERVGGGIARTGSLLAREADWGPNCRNDQTGTMNHGPSRGWNVIDQSGKRDATSAVVCLQGPPAA
ncbi:hypothetical protein NEUTE1DRAFT_97944 [Neurospora tetrasperma FGSC 2508]|uniref:Uncharacterized protein n=1 Tax=Neurospora tetrasperma (strain FGSC 2508 / ATCC MYA-4615 / P0657) TaxID=510951 RepID=F8MEF8_NEUT8|nr:uncharacterized protein NEUTE1DRAFT_97944 [Neurospora tetrasperma FGSC 2508]EGO60789.1 hypothetical protein NEUTE1DRAFT_97944 [Neurospora tetrasperma FGSC 2508]